MKYLVSLPLSLLLFSAITFSCSNSRANDNNFTSCEERIDALIEVKQMLEKENDALMKRIGELESELANK